MTSTASEAPVPPPPPPPPRQSLEQRMADIKPSKMDINSMVMDFLTSEGYLESARKFAAEANISQPRGNAESMIARRQVRNAILAGDIQTAIDLLNDFNPEILDLDPSLHFSLLRLQLIELIRPCAHSSNPDIGPALTFAQTSLAPRAPTNPKFLSDLEQTMALLIFSPGTTLPPTLSGLLEPELRRQVGASVNEAMLKSQGLRSQTKLKRLVKLRAWSERKGREQNKDFPKDLDLWGLQSPSQTMEDAVMSQDGEPEMEGIAT